jgi:hypothetical protein
MMSFWQLAFVLLGSCVAPPQAQRIADVRSPSTTPAQQSETYASSESEFTVEVEDNTAEKNLIVPSTDTKAPRKLIQNEPKPFAKPPEKLVTDNVEPIIKITCDVSPYTRPPVATNEWTSSSRIGDGSVFSFRGNKIGDPIDRMFPCHDQDTVDNISSCFTKKNDVSQKICYDRSIRKRSNYSDGEIAGIPVFELKYHYLDNRLAGLRSTMDMKYFKKMSELLEAKYGEPSYVETGAAQNQLGVQIDTVTMTWSTPDGDLTLAAPSLEAYEVDYAVIEFTTPEVVAREKASVKEKALNAL